MVPIPNRGKKLYYLLRRQKGLCACGCGRELVGMVDLHHMLSDSKGNRKQFPLFIHSILNLQAFTHSCHINGYNLKHKTPYQAELYQKYLAKHKKVCDWVNGNTGGCSA
ncbi:MAG: hypothetical protein ACP5N7_02370 [Candidatus Pacearchaeota archaeon]